MTSQSKVTAVDSAKFNEITKSIEKSVLDIVQMKDGFQSKIKVTHLIDDYFGNNDDGDELFTADARVELRVDLEEIEGYKPSHIQAVIDVIFSDCHEETKTSNQAENSVKWSGHYTLDNGYYTNNVVWGEEDDKSFFNVGSDYGLSTEQDVELSSSVAEVFSSVTGDEAKKLFGYLFDEAMKSRTAVILGHAA